MYRGCGDHSCIINKPEGQGTNGGCRCKPIYLRLRIQELEKELKECYRREHDRNYVSLSGEDFGRIT